MSKITMRHVRTTPNFHRLEGLLPDGKTTWFVYVPKRIDPSDPDRDLTMYTGRFIKPESQDPIDDFYGCSCEGSHHHAPVPRRKYTRKTTKKSTSTKKGR